MSKKPIVLGPYKKEEISNRKTKGKQPPKTSFVTPEQRQVRQIPDTKVLMMGQLKSLPTSNVEKMFNALLTKGYRPILINNTMVVMVRAVQVSAPTIKLSKPKKDKVVTEEPILPA